MNTTPFATSRFTSAAIANQDQLADAAGSPIDRTRERALVLGGAGSSGNAWLIGVIAGLFESGLDVTGADLIIGTSAGATTAAQITGASPAQLFADLLSAAPPIRTNPVESERHRVPSRPGTDHMRRTSEIITAASDPVDMRRRLGASALALDADSDGSGQAGWRATVAARLPNQHWPQGLVLIPAVDAHTGEPVVFDRESGVDLVDAVAASCSSGSAYTIGDRQFIDGGYRRSSENADLAAGYGRVLVLSPLGGRSRAPVEWNMHLAAQVKELRALGNKVETILPDNASLEAFGPNLMDYSRRAPAAQAGFDQGRAHAAQITEFWR